MGRNKQPARRTGTREPKYGRYLIFTNGEKTEVNYFNGLRKSLPIEVQDNIQISIYTCKLDNFENEIQRVKSKYQYSKTYIVLDKDRESQYTLKNIKSIAKRNDCTIIFSAPCIEYWFLKHFNTTVTFIDSDSLPASQQCIKELGKYLKNYNKVDINIYNILNSIGNETTAINLAEKEYKRLKSKNLYEIKNATNMFAIIKDIKNIP